tara:strand:+ start:18790 stop:19227 length:438 start_codon:yes stop_codon:yes gene_type:complete
VILRRKWYPRNRFIPPELGLDAPTRRAVLKAAGDSWMFQTRNGLRALAWFVGGLVAIVLVLVLFWPLLKEAGLTSLAGVVIYLPIATLWFLFLLWQQRNGLPQRVYTELRARGHDVCLGCGYTRQGIDAADPCPECGSTSPRVDP